MYKQSKKPNLDVSWDNRDNNDNNLLRGYTVTIFKKSIFKEHMKLQTK